MDEVNENDGKISKQCDGKQKESAKIRRKYEVKESKRASKEKYRKKRTRASQRASERARNELICQNKQKCYIYCQC